MGTSGNGNGNGNGNGDWAASFAAFHERHKDRSGKKLKFTSVWNTQLEAWMDDPEVPLEWRCLAFAWRFSQGNSSDYCVDKIGGRRIGQKECAERFAVDKRRVSDAFGYLKGLYYIEPGKGYSISPVDNPAERQSKSPCPSGLSEPPKTEFQVFLDDWKVHAPADFAEFESAYATVQRIKKVRWGLFRQWRTARTATPMPVTTLNSSVGQASSSAAEPIPQERVTAPPCIEKSHSSSSAFPVTPRKSKAEEEEESALYQIFKGAYPAGHFDGAKAKPLFDGKKKSEQLAAIERLRVFVASDRWKDDDGRWIPLASTWLQSAYTEDPPPLVKKKTKAVGSSEESYFERRVREEREASNG